MKKFGNVLWGIVLIIIGLIIGGNALGITNINIFFDGWWTLFIIIPCFIGLFKDNEKTVNLIGLLIGVALLLACQNIIDFHLIWKLAFPIILVIIGTVLAYLLMLLTVSVMPATVPIDFAPWIMISTFAGMILMGAIGGLIPIRSILKVDPSKAV